MMLWKNCLAAALSVAAAAFVTASAQTQVQGVVQPAIPASQPVVHAVPLNPPEPARQPAPQSAQKPAIGSVEKHAEKPVHKHVRRRVHEPTYTAAPVRTVEPTPPILPAPQPYAQPAPIPHPYAQPAPQLHAEPAPQPYAEPAPQPNAQPAARPVVNWTLQVIRDGQQVDSFGGATTVGQARTNEHHKVVTHNVGCKNQPAGSIDLQRTITVAPLRADPAGAVLAIHARETVESDTTLKTPGGCALPPQPSEVHANHPGLVVPAGQWVDWQIVSQDPSLQYRVRASVEPSSAQP